MVVSDIVPVHQGIDAAVATATATAAAAVVSADGIRRGKERLDSIQGHLKFHPGKRGGTGSSSAAAKASTTPSSAPGTGTGTGTGSTAVTKAAAAPRKWDAAAAVVGAAGAVASFLPVGTVANAVSAVPAAAASTASALAPISPLSSTRLRWIAPPLVAFLSLLAAFKHRNTRERILSMVMRGGVWALKRHFAPTYSPSSQPFLAQAEVSTQHCMHGLGARLRAQLPLEDTLARMKQARALKLQREEIVTLWLDIEVFTFTRIAVGVVVLGLTHFVSAAVHALEGCGSVTSRGLMASMASEVMELPLRLDLDRIVAATAERCRDALERRNMHKLSSVATVADVEGLLRELRSCLEDLLGLATPAASAASGSGAAQLHEAVLGEERAGAADCLDSVAPARGPGAVREETVLQKLRDLLENAGPKALLGSTLSSFFAVADQHVTQAFVAVVSAMPPKEGDAAGAGEEGATAAAVTENLAALEVWESLRRRRRRREQACRIYIFIHTGTHAEAVPPSGVRAHEGDGGRQRIPVVSWGMHTHGSIHTPALHTHTHTHTHTAPAAGV